jgi:hypothetical protein
MNCSSDQGVTNCLLGSSGEMPCKIANTDSRLSTCLEIQSVTRWRQLDDVVRYTEILDILPKDELRDTRSAKIAKRRDDTSGLNCISLVCSHLIKSCSPP